MKTCYRVALGCVAGAALGVAAVTGLQAQVKPPVYVVFDFSDMFDEVGFKKGVATTDPIAAMSAFGGHYVIRTNKPVGLDGAAPPVLYAVIAFDSEEKAKAWRESPAVKQLDANRMKTSTSRAFMVEGFGH